MPHLDPYNAFNPYKDDGSSEGRPARRQPTAKESLRDLSDMARYFNTQAYRDADIARVLSAAAERLREEIAKSEQLQAQIDAEALKAETGRDLVVLVDASGSMNSSGSWSPATPNPAYAATEAVVALGQTEADVFVGLYDQRGVRQISAKTATVEGLEREFCGGPGEKIVEFIQATVDEAGKPRHFVFVADEDIFLSFGKNGAAARLTELLAQNPGTTVDFIAITKRADIAARVPPVLKTAKRVSISIVTAPELTATLQGFAAKYRKPQRKSPRAGRNAGPTA